MTCDKCGRNVPRNNDASVLASIVSGNPAMLLFAHARHLLPVHEDGEEVCEGSPSRAQYLEGQPRDTRGYTYHEEYEPLIRAAYEMLQSMAEQEPADSI